MTMKQLLTLCAVLIVTTGSAATQSIPRYDPESYCVEVAEAVGRTYPGFRFWNLDICARPPAKKNDEVD